MFKTEKLVHIGQENQLMSHSCPDNQRGGNKFVAIYPPAKVIDHFEDYIIVLMQ